MNIFTIPTNRLVLRAVESLYQETKVCNSNENVILILDNSDEMTFAQNQKDLRAFAEKNDVCIKIAGWKQMRLLSEKIAEKMEDADVFHLVAPQNNDYGRIFNMIYLYTALLGENAFHRRDSDCFVNHISSPDAYPVKRENDLLGKTIADVSYFIKIPQKNVFSDSEKILITGSDYWGDWNLDIKNIVSENDSMLRELFELLNNSKETADELTNAKYTDANERKESKPILKTGKGDSVYPECGNISMQDVFEWIPNFVGRYGIGFDYHTYLLSHVLKVPTVYHENKIEHKHDNKRKNNKTVSSLAAYFQGVIKQIDINELYVAFIQNHLQDIINTYSVSGMELIKAISDDSLPHAFEMSLKDVDRQKRKENIVHFCSILKKSSDTLLQEAAAQIESQTDQILAELDQDYADSITLQKKWEKIMQCVKSMQNDAALFFC